MTHDYIEFNYIIPGHALEIHAAGKVMRDDFGKLSIGELHIDTYELDQDNPTNPDLVQRYAGDFTEAQWSDIEQECIERLYQDFEDREEEARSA